MKYHEVLFALALEAQRFDAELPPEALALAQAGLAAVQRAKTFREFIRAMQAMPPGPEVLS